MARSKLLPHYRVEVARATGDWLTTPEYVGDVDMDEHLATPDTDISHCDTCELGDGCLPQTLTTIAVTITWRE